MRDSEEKREILARFRSISNETKQTLLGTSKGSKVLLLRLRVLDLLTDYRTLTVRMLFYRLVSVSGYPNDRKFYKRLQYSLKILRKLFPELNEKFEDVTRRISKPPRPRPPIELWVEKASLQYFLQDMADRFHIPVLSTRGFASITALVKAVERAKNKGIRKVLVVSDHDPSGLQINEVMRRELPVQVERIALTMEQVERYKLPPLRVKRSDSRARKYIERYGDHAWEVEALPPRVLRNVVASSIRKNLPAGFLEEVRMGEAAAKITKPIERQVAEMLREEALKLMKKGIGKEKIAERLKRLLKRGGEP